MFNEYRAPVVRFGVVQEVYEIPKPVRELTDEELWGEPATERSQQWQKQNQKDQTSPETKKD
jgi:hypothetical protein